MHRTTQGEIKEAIVSHFGSHMEDNLFQIVEEVRPLFKQQAEHLFGQAQQALDARNYDQLWKTAHTLKGMSGNLGLAHFSSLCRDLEILAEQQALHAAALKVDQLMVEFGQVRSVLDEWH
jgi:HPt (histidine-containing phosphotransfer) domain-containing protein